jgi:hypothetical protein
VGGSAFTFDRRHHSSLAEWLGVALDILRIRHHISLFYSFDITMIAASRAAAVASSSRICRICMSIRSSRFIPSIRPSPHPRIQAYRQPRAAFATVARHSAEKSSADDAVEKIQELYVFFPRYSKLAAYLE